MVSLNTLSMQYGERTLFRDVSLTIGAHDRIGLVGSNGTGKSTLMRIIAGIIEPDSGSIGKAGYVTVGYLPQDGMVSAGSSLVAEVETAFEDVLEVERELADAHDGLASLDPASAEHADLLEVFGELQHKLEDLDAFRMRSKIERVLMGLGFRERDFLRPCEEFSGGWQMRIALAKLLLREPSVLLLDEPTNHLDIDSLRWLEEYLKTYNGAIILVSHDRAFLDNLTRKTLALHSGLMEIYSGNYTFFEKESRLRREQQLNAAKNQERQIEQTQRFIERFRYKATKARQVQSRIKMLERMETIETGETEEEIHFRFPPPPPGGAVVLELSGIVKSYDTLCVFNGLSLSIDRGDRIAVVGTNGAGKSTLARICAGVESFDAGIRKTGHNIVTSYFAQHQADELDPHMEALAIIDSAATGEIRTKLRTILGAFLFHGDDVFKRVGVLSGGEKSRLALAKMLLQPANFLIMDEPTNHLDMRSKSVLQEALAGYEGTFLIVSHDRSFLDPLVTKVIEIREGSRVRVIPGTVSDYLERHDAEEAQATAITAGKAVSEQGAPAARDRKRLEAEHRQKLYKILKPHRDRLGQVERRITAMEERKQEIETAMADPGFYRRGDEAKAISAEYKDMKSRLENAYAEWEGITEVIERLQREHGGG